MGRGFALGAQTKVWGVMLCQHLKELPGKDGVRYKECPTRNRSQHEKTHRPGQLSGSGLHDYRVKDTLRRPEVSLVKLSVCFRVWFLS